MARSLLGIVVLAAVVIGGAGYWIWSAAQSASPERREATARDLVERISVSVSVAETSLAATRAIADFGIDAGVRLVLVRILDEIRLELRIETPRDALLAGPPRLCLVGPAWAPDDAGLSDRCWGEPDLAAMVAAQLSPDLAGRVSLAADRPLLVDASVRRGDKRCDYRPGTWQLEIAVEPLIDGQSIGPFEAPPASFEVPLEAEGTPLPFVESGDSRYCGLAATVWREQGEPVVLSP
jgi:hypothetical protein